VLDKSPSPEPYAFGFTAGGLGVGSCRKLAALFLESGNWQEARKVALESNALQQNRNASLVRLEREFRMRLQTLTESQITLLAETSDELVARPLAMLASFKRYPFIFDFCVLTLRPKLAVYDSEIRPSDFENFIEQVAPYHPEVETLTDKTMAKIRQRLLKMLSEAALTSGGQSPEIQPAVLPQEVTSVIVEESPFILHGFLIPEPEIAILSKS
jgi:hypothetical protein